MVILVELKIAVIFYYTYEIICINSCNIDIYSIGDDGKKCGLCQDLYENKKFKKFGVEGCFDSKPDNYYYLYEEYKIIKECSEHCASCESYETCQKCEDGYEMSTDGTSDNIICRNKKQNYTFFVFTLIITVILFIISIFICKICCSRKKSDSKVTEYINIELKDYNQ